MCIRDLLAWVLSALSLSALYWQPFEGAVRQFADYQFDATTSLSLPSGSFDRLIHADVFRQPKRRPGGNSAEGLQAART